MDKTICSTSKSLFKTETKSYSICFIPFETARILNLYFVKLQSAQDEEGIPGEALNPEIKRSSFSSWNSSRRSAQETQSAVIKAVTDVKKEHELMKSQNDAFDAITAGDRKSTRLNSSY